MKEIIHFDIRAPYAFFKDKSGLEFNSSYPSITPTNVFGILGAILGLDGFAKFQKHKAVEYLQKLEDIKVGIKINNENILQTFVKFNDSTKNGVSTRTDRGVSIAYSVLNNVDYTIFVLIDTENEVHVKLKDFMLSGKSRYPIYLGKNEFICSPEKVSCSLLEEVKNNSIHINSLFPKEFAVYTNNPDEADEDSSIGTKMFFQIPISSDPFSGEYNRYEKVTFNSMAQKIVLKENDVISKIGSDIVYLFSQKR